MSLLIYFFSHTPIMRWVVICLMALGVEEIYRAWRKSANKPSSSPRDKMLNISSGVATCVMLFILTPLTTLFILSIGNRIGFGLIDLRFFPHHDLPSQILSGLLLMFLEDFLYYFYHRAVHKIPILWDMHAVHHSATEMDVTVTLRRHWLETPLQKIAVVVPLALIFRLTPIEMTIVSFGHAAFVFFAHMDIPLRMKWISWFLTSPRLHRLHHSLEAKHLDSNFAQVFPVIDMMFGTYVAPENGERPPTGLSSGERIETVSDILFWPFRKWVKRFSG